MPDLKLIKRAKKLWLGIKRKVKKFRLYIYRRCLLLRKLVTRASKKLVIGFWRLLYKARNFLFVVNHKYKNKFLLILALGIIAANLLVFPDLNELFGKSFMDDSMFKGFQNFLLSLGVAFMGAAAIGFALVMFALQVNVERMPHGLFRKSKSDFQLLGSFFLTFGFSISIALLSLLPDKTHALLATNLALWAVILIIAFFLLAYRRALELINPNYQLSTVVIDCQENLSSWSNAATRLTRRVDAESEESVLSATTHTQQDLDRANYLVNNPIWLSAANRGIAYCMSYTRRYAVQGDYEVSNLALRAIVDINHAYIKAKGRAFFSNNSIIDNPLATDGFINGTLEHLRQNVQDGLSRNDEQQIEKTFKAFFDLAHVYGEIDYASIYAEKTHSQLAIGYLSEAVLSVIPHKLADVMLEGVRLMGDAAQLMIAHGEPNSIVSISEKLTLIACTGAASKPLLPVTNASVKQFARMTFSLVRSESTDIKFATDKIREDVKMLVSIILNVPESGFDKVHSNAMAPFYSATTTDSLTAWFVPWVNAISEAKEDDEDAIGVINNVKEWADGMYRFEKDNLLLAIEKRSFFTFDMLRWIANTTKMLLAISNAKACSPHNRDELKKSAIWLISVISFVPTDEESVKFLETYQISNPLFDAAIDAYGRGYLDIAIDIRDLLLSWTFSSGKYRTGWSSLERGIYGLACLNIEFGLDDASLLGLIEKRVNQIEAPSLEVRMRSAVEIKREAVKHHSKNSVWSKIDYVMAHVDQVKLMTILLSIADKLVPENLGPRPALTK